MYRGDIPFSSCSVARVHRSPSVLGLALTMIALSCGCGARPANVENVEVVAAPQKSDPVTTKPPIGKCTDAPVEEHREIGFRCRTQVGKSFEWVRDEAFGAAWRSPDGIVWTPSVGELDQEHAAALCQEKGGTLPGFGDLDRNDQGGMYELFPDLPRIHDAAAKRGFWTPKNASEQAVPWPLGAPRCPKYQGNMLECLDAVHSVHCIRRLKQTLPVCNPADTQPLGYTCATAVGSIFERVNRDRFGTAWKGPDGLVWSAVESEEDATQDEAKALCENLGARLPTAIELQRGESDLVRAVLATSPKGRPVSTDALWSSDVLKSGDGGYLSGTYGSGGGGIVTYDRTTYKRSTVCVADHT